jgi:pimeloyl-ACP methyl ester carboxylesterase
MVARRERRVQSAVLGAAIVLLTAGPAVSRAQPAAPPAATIASAPDQFFLSGSARLRFREVGSGEPVVLVHGLTRQLEHWAGVGDSLARDHRVIVFDLRGHGQSTRFNETRYFGEELANDVVRLLDHLRLPHAHLIGHSLGAAVAANVAARYPTRVASASLIAGPFREDTGSFNRDDDGFVADIETGVGARRFLQWLFPGTSDSVATSFSQEMMSRNDPATVGATMRSMGSLMVPRTKASVIRAATLVAVGDRDPLQDHSRTLSSWWPRARLVVVPGADHGNVIQRRELMAAIRATLQSASGAR